MQIEVTTIIYILLGISTWAILYTHSQKKIKLVIDIAALIVWLISTIILSLLRKERPKTPTG